MPDPIPASDRPTDLLRDLVAALFRHPPGAERLGDATPGEIADAVLSALPAPALAVARQLLGGTSVTAADLGPADGQQKTRLLARLHTSLTPIPEETDEELEPVQLRWGLDDVMYGDDDTTTLLLSGPGREPYWVELDPERTAALRDALAGPAVLPAPADRAATLNEAADVVDATDFPADEVDLFENGARWATDRLRRLAGEAAAGVEQDTASPSVACSVAAHLPHFWAPQPGMTPVRCPGTPPAAPAAPEEPTR